MSRDRRRPTRRESGPAPAVETTSRPAAGSGGAGPKPQWRETIDSFGGFLTVGAVVVALVVVAAIFVFNRGGDDSSQTSTQVSADGLMGSAVAATDVKTDRQHISDPLQLQIPKGEPPTRGPHFAVPQNTGVYTQPVPDGNAIHALEHGIVWISYNPSKVDAATIKNLGDLGKQYAVDVIVSPRPDNERAIDIVSWGQILVLDKFDKDTLEKFITTNRNRAPEPFVRTTSSM